MLSRPQLIRLDGSGSVSFGLRACLICSEETTAHTPDSYKVSQQGPRALISLTCRPQSHCPLKASGLTILEARFSLGFRIYGVQRLLGVRGKRFLSRRPGSGVVFGVRAAVLASMTFSEAHCGVGGGILRQPSGVAPTLPAVTKSLESRMCSVPRHPRSLCLRALLRCPEP